jgi:hypothetical protein
MKWGGTQRHTHTIDSALERPIDRHTIDRTISRGPKHINTSQHITHTSHTSHTLDTHDTIDDTIDDR